MNHTKRLSQIMSRIDAGMPAIEAKYAPPVWAALGGDDYLDILERMNADQIKRDRATTCKALVLVCVAFGMALASVALSRGYDRALDAITAPHLEGF